MKKPRIENLVTLSLLSYKNLKIIDKRQKMRKVLPCLAMTVIPAAYFRAQMSNNSMTGDNA
jgi:hypothetical protein